jgi:tetratricopeptide (TPR) repeat protein
VELVLGVVGTIIGMVGAAIAWAQLRRTPRVSTGARVGEVEAPQDAEDKRTFDVSAIRVLRPPTGRLPEQVRGRVDLLSLLTKKAKTSDGYVHVLAGLGGVGKSTIAISVADVAMDLGRTVWWVPAVDSATIAAVLLGLARELGAPSSDVDEALAGRRDASGLVWRYLEKTAGWVLVFDNADDVDELRTGHDRHGPIVDGMGWLRPSHHGMVLVTSRISDATMWGRHAIVHAVPALSEQDGAKVLLDLAPAAGNVAEARQLSVRLGGLPLALHHAGSYLASSFADERTFNSFQDSLKQHFGRLMDRRGMDDRSTVMATWELSLDALARRGIDDARPLLQILSCFAAASPVPYRLLQGIGRSGALTSCNLSDTLSALVAVGLLETRPSPADENRTDILVHPLVAETQRARFTPEDKRIVLEGAVNGFGEAVATLDRAKPTEWPIWLQLLPHINVLLSPQRIEDVSESTLHRLLEVASFTIDTLIWAGRWQTALDLARRAVIASVPLGKDHPTTLGARHYLAEALMNNGQLQNAEDEFRKVLRLRETILGRTHRSSLETRARLGFCLRLAKRPEEAEKEFKIVLEERRKAFGDDDQGTLDARHNLAYIAAMRGRLDEAERDFRLLLGKRQEILGKNHPSTLATLHDLSWVLGKRADFDEAKRGLESVRDQWLEIASEKHPSVLNAEFHLALIHRMSGKKSKALSEFRNVLKGRNDVLGEFHPSTLQTRNEIASTLLELGQHEDAEKEFRAVLRRSRTALGNEHPVTLEAQRALRATGQ